MFFLLSVIGTFIDFPPSSPPTPHPHERSPVPPLTPLNVFYSPHRGERALDPSRRASSPPRPSWSLPDALYSPSSCSDPPHGPPTPADRYGSTPPMTGPPAAKGWPQTGSPVLTSRAYTSPIGVE